MKKYLCALAALVLLLSCNKQNNPEKQITTDGASDITEYSATLMGSVNFPYEKAGFLFDTRESLEDAVDISATGYGGTQFSVKVTGLLPSTTYYYKSYVQNGDDKEYGTVLTFATKDSKCPVGSVDLGIVMTREDGTSYNLYWAKSNLCDSGLCAKETDYGDYYAWGETEAKKRFDWDNYKFADGGIYSLTKYVPSAPFGSLNGFQDGKSVLDPEDDAAHAKLGGKWRMPTKAEWANLGILKWERTTRNGINGYLVTAPNGGSIFFPFAGMFNGNEYEGARTNGYYWSSSIDPSEPRNAMLKYVDFNSENMKSMYRSLGMTIRPVTE